MPEPAVTRIETLNGTTYEIGESCPGLADLKIGAIFFQPEEADESIDPDDEGRSFASRVPAHYELWCTGDEFALCIGSLLQEKITKEQFAEALVKSGKVVRRVVYVHAVRDIDEVWGPAEAFHRIVERIKEEETGEGDAGSDDETPVQAAQ